MLALDELRALRAADFHNVVRAADALVLEAGGDEHGVRATLVAARSWLDLHADRRDALEAGARGLRSR